MSKDLFEALEMLELERGISVDFMMDKIEKAILKACKNNYGGNEDVVIIMNKDIGEFDVYLRKTVVEKVKDNAKEITILDAQKIDADTDIGEKVAVKLDTKEFGRIAAQTARNIIRQGIRDGERGQMMKEFQKRLKEIVTAFVEKVDPKTGAASLRIGKAEAVLPKSERIAGEQIKEGDHIKIYIVDVKETEKGPKAIISRTHPELIRKLFEYEIPEISEGIIEVKGVSREAGSRSKVAVSSNDKDIDPVGSCIGTRGRRIAEILKEIKGEKIDVIEFDDDPVKFISAALAPAEVCRVEISEPGIHSCRAIVPDSQLSLAIGNKGQNVRLAAKLTGWKIDIKPESASDDENSLEE